MLFMSTIKGGTDPIRQLLGRQGALWLNDPTLAMQPLGFNRVQPGTFDRQRTDQETHTLTSGLDLPVMLPDPGAHGLANVPGGIIPDQGQHSFAQSSHFRATPVQKLSSDGADGPTVYEAQPHLLLWLSFSRTPAH